MLRLGCRIYAADRVSLDRGYCIALRGDSQAEPGHTTSPVSPAPVPASCHFAMCTWPAACFGGVALVDEFSDELVAFLSRFANTTTPGPNCYQWDFVETSPQT